MDLVGSGLKNDLKKAYLTKFFAVDKYSVDSFSSQNFYCTVRFMPFVRLMMRSLQ